MTTMPDGQSKPRRPILRWHGGKWMIGPWIVENLPSHRVYVEPYGGAASVLMRKFRSFAEVYNDLDDEIYNLFVVLRDQVTAAELVRRLRLTPWSRTEFYASYEPTEDPIEKARQVVVRSYMAFGTTGRRRNKSGFRGKAEHGNSTGIQDWVNYPDSLKAVTARLIGVVIENRPALDIIKQQDDPDTLFYVDPPYPHSTRTSIRWPSENDKCYAHEMSDIDHLELAKTLHDCKGMIVLSGYRCGLYDDVYKEWQRLDKDTNADGGRSRVESLWFNPAAVQRRSEDLQQRGLFG